MKDKILKLIDSAIGGAEDNYYRAKMQFGRMTDEQLDKEYGKSGKTCRQHLQEYSEDKQEKLAMKKWFIENT